MKVLEEFQKIERTFDQHQVSSVKRGRQYFWPGACGHGSVHQMPRHSARWLPGLFMPPPWRGTSRNFSANVSSSAWPDVWFNPTVWESHLSDKVMPSMQPLVRAWQIFCLCFHPGDDTPGLVLKKVKSKGLLRCFEKALFKKILLMYQQCIRWNQSTRII